MRGGEASHWLLSVLFAATGLWYLAEAARHRGRGAALAANRVGSACHAAMGAAMVTMFWAWGTAVPAILIVTVFTAAAFWFVSRAIFPSQRTAGIALPHAARAGAHAWYHAAMMASMVWMAVTTAAGSAGPAGTGGAGSAMGTMPGMAMGGGMGGGMAAPAAEQPFWLRDGCAVLGLAFGVAAAWLVTSAARDALRAGPDARRVLFGNGVAAVMAIGTAVALFEMA